MGSDGSASSVEKYISPDGQLYFCVVTGRDGDVTLGFDGFQWHTHADILAATTGLPEMEAVRRFVYDLVGGTSIVVLYLVDGQLQDMWVTNDPMHDAAYPQTGETVILRYWDGRVWHAGIAPAPPT